MQLNSDSSYEFLLTKGMKYILRGSSKLTMSSWAMKCLIQKKEESICRAYAVVIIVTFWCEKWEKKEKWLICQDVEQHKSCKANSSISLKKVSAKTHIKPSILYYVLIMDHLTWFTLAWRNDIISRASFQNFQLLIRRFVMVMHKWEL